LQLQGPVVQVTVGVAEFVANQLIQNGIKVPDPISGYGLIDSGASSTCIDDDIAHTLGLPIIDQAIIATPSHDATSKNVYPANIVFTGTAIKSNDFRAIGASLSNQGIIALIGRDILSNFTLFYNGPFGEITISY
jgi:hypothetical protein